MCIYTHIQIHIYIYFQGYICIGCGSCYKWRTQYRAPCHGLTSLNQDTPSNRKCAKPGGKCEEEYKQRNVAWQMSSLCVISLWPPSRSCHGAGTIIKYLREGMQHAFSQGKHLICIPKNIIDIILPKTQSFLQAKDGEAMACCSSARISASLHQGASFQ